MTFKLVNNNNNNTKLPNSEFKKKYLIQPISKCSNFKIINVMVGAEFLKKSTRKLNKSILHNGSSSGDVFFILGIYLALTSISIILETEPNTILN